MTDTTIPPEALKAAQRDAAVAIYSLVEPDTRAHELTEGEVADIARAACLAMLRNWPGANWDEAHRIGIVLPLPTENTNAEA